MTHVSDASEVTREEWVDEKVDGVGSGIREDKGESGQYGYHHIESGHTLG